MKTLQRKLTIILTFIVASAMLAIGLLCVYKPIKTRAETTTAVIDLGGVLSGTQEMSLLEFYSESSFELGDTLFYNGERAEITELPSEAEGTDYYTLRCETYGKFYQSQRKIITVIVNPVSEELFFNTGASASLDATDLYRLRFALYISESAAQSNSLLTVSFVSGTDAGCKVGFESDEIAERQATKDISGYHFTSGYTTVYIYVTGPLHAEMQLLATVGGAAATSDARSIYYVWQKAVENNFGGMVVEDSVKNYITLTVGFSSENNTFEISQAAQLSQNSGLSLMVKVPEAYLTQLKQGKRETSKETLYSSISGVPIGTRYTYEDHFLYICRTTDLNDYGNAGMKLSWGYMYHVSPGECIEPYTNEAEPLSEEFLSRGMDVFSLGLPTNAEQEYYYFATILKVTRTDAVYVTGKQDQESFSTSIESFSRNYYQTSLKSLALEVLERDASMTDGERAWMQDVAGVKPDTNEITVTLKYKELTDYATLTEKSHAFSVKSVWAQNKTLVLSALYDLTEFNNIAKLNAVYTGDFWRDGYRYTTQKRIILQAEDFEYSYNAGLQTGTLTVIYADFQYKDLSLRVTNNDPANNLTIDYYTADVVAGATSTTLTFRFADIEEQLHNSCNWLFDFGKENIRISGKPEGVTTQLTEEALIVTFPNSKENELVNLSLIGVAEIIEDVEYTLTYEYAELTLNGTEISETWKTSAPIVKLYSEIVTCNFTNFMTDYGEIVNEAINPAFLGGAEYYIPVSIRKEYSAYDSETHTCKITVEYTYNTLFGITNNYDNEIIFKALNHSSLNYTGGDFVGKIPSGYRVKGISTSKPDKLTVTNAEDYRNAKIEVRTSTTEKEVLPIVINYTDSWNLKINYLENYADQRIQSGEKDAKPCFAEKKVFSGTVKVKDYEDIYALTNEDIQSILGLKSLDILGLATVEKITVKFDGISTYTADLSYSHAALKQIDYDGNMLEIKIPLTSYSDWCKQYGQDWSILFLNTPERHYFKYSNDVTRENLYGFFSVAVFKEQVSDLNYWFKNNTGDGCMTIFEGKQVSGSGVYKFFDNLTTKGVITSVLGYVGMSFCEIVNDDNAMYYSYFFYLDGTSDNAYLATNGADDAGDTDSAIKNALNDAKEWIKKTGDKLNGANAMKWLKILGGAALGILAVTALIAGVYKILTVSGIIKPKRKTATAKKTKPAKKKKSSTKAKK